MCGIVAISSLQHRGFPIDQCLSEIGHRGPDGKGVYVSPDADAHLGHVRLSILDLSNAGLQPMVDATGRYRISYNGEVYNFRELRSYLESKFTPIQWKTDTDTEIIVEGFAREGIGFLDRLNGIFALAIYDSHERLLHVLRDPLGIKPLFFTEQNGNQYFCSELKGLLVLPDLKRTLRREALAEQLAFMYIPEPLTLYQEFNKVIPGVCFTYKEGREVSQVSLFKHLESAEEISSENQAIEIVQASFASAVERQIIADVPVSLFLSGGLDSSAVAHQTVSSGAEIKDAYTIAFSCSDRNLDAQSDDLHFAKIMAKSLGLDLKIITAKQDFLELIPELCRFMEDGFSDPAALNTYLICSAARKEGVKVMLSGQGADEYLGGYRRYVAERLIRKTPAPILWALRMVNSILPSQLPGRFNALHRRITRLAELAKLSDRARLLGMYTWASPAQVNSMFLEPLDLAYGDAFYDYFDSVSDRDVINSMMNIDHHYDLMSLNLCYTDRMSMAVGVEARVPFLDFEFVRVMNSIPISMKVKGAQTKHIFKRAMEPYLPNEIIYREKAGFGLPIRAWLRNSHELVSHYLEKSRLQQQGLFSVESVGKMLSEQMSGRKDHANTIFTLLSQQIWLESNSI